MFDLEPVNEITRNIDNPIKQEYLLYLSSDHWKILRGSVLARCGGMCEGCREAAATEVHHLTYEHVYCEFLFELLALCADCHARIHDK